MLDKKYYIQPFNKDFILNNVYSDKRSPSNWLEYEWKWRGMLDDGFIFITHSTEFIDSICIPETKVILCKINHDVAWKHYSKVNPHHQKNIFEKEWQDLNSDFEKVDYDNSITIDTTVLNDAVLERGFYSRIVNFLNLDDNYLEASHVHSKWFRILRA